MKTATLDFDGMDATFNGREWTSDDPMLERTLNAFERMRRRNAPLYEPDRVRAAAEAAAKEYGGTWLTPLTREPQNSDDDQTVY